MLYTLFRITEFDGFVVFCFLFISLYIIYRDKSQEKETLTYFAVNIALYLLLQYGTYALPISPHPHHYWYNMLILFAIPLATSTYFLQGYFAGKLLYSLFYVSLLQLYKIVWSPLYSAEGVISQSKYIFLDIFSFVLLIVLLYAFFFIFRKSVPIISNSVGRRLLLLSYFPLGLLVYYSLDLMGIPYFDVFRDAILALIIIPALPMLYDLFITTVEAYEERRKLDNALTETRAQVHRYRYSLEIDERIKKERHELKNNYLFIQTLLHEKKYDELNDYINNSIGEKLDNISDVSTGNLMIDYILNRKISEARKHHIKIYTEIALPSDLTVNDESFCTVFLNLFNNAMEACEKVDFPDIHILLKISQNYLCCEIRNKANIDSIINNPDLETTKPDSENHGLGLKIVEETITKCDGIFQTSVEGNYFLAKFMIPVVKA
ncbi:sensor histidine kinase [Butyrivibrio sp. INlla16]|uniref:sensor histidine kinase n=1 Tax=Butyrivibrio sp. INlla16 TaxID=1520807 RepID=UPI0008873BE5|nr:sensor histidine kinase [Butyrivibrio sp. INlla16]SDB34030.1 Sensor histidine kinase YesM [Butyrivibrio sp. INlla16]